MKQNKFIIVVPVYNSEQWINRCLESILNQDYTNYDLIVVDDHSDDNTWNEIAGYNVRRFRNKERNGSGLANIYQGINLASEDKEDVIVTVDGDDYLADNHVLSHLNEVYQEDIWMTYGSFLPLSGKYRNTCQPLNRIVTVNKIGERIIISTNSETYRASGVWVTSHLRTFKRWLWDLIDQKDLKENSEFYKVAWDLAFMYPLIEMAGDHVRFIGKILYIYNDLNPNCDGTKKTQDQIETGERIQSKPSYKRWERH